VKAGLFCALLYNGRMFVDEVEILVRSGRGGDGMVHFHREKFVSRGGPDGGDGGKGGDVIIQVTIHNNTLAAFRHKTRYIAESGKNGGINNQSGKSAPDLVIKVPAGTLVYDKNSRDLLADLKNEGESVIVSHGGRGGKGNQHFASPSNQAPRYAEKGEPGEERTLKLELQLIADVGIIGMPNAGKSSLLAALTNAKPKIADYPFTTLVPNLGVAELSDGTTIVLADIPGLIEGAHSGIGLGDAFLKHVQRTRVLIHLLDGLSADPVADYSQINSEMALFDPALAKKPQIVSLNKTELPDVSEKFDSLKSQFKKKKVDIIPISAATRKNTKELLNQCAELLQSIPHQAQPQEMPIYRPSYPDQSFNIEKINEGWLVSGKAIERAAEMTFWEMESSIRRFQRIMESLGIDKALRDAGVREGDVVVIGKHELNWEEVGDFE